MQYITTRFMFLVSSSGSIASISVLELVVRHSKSPYIIKGQGNLVLCFSNSIKCFYLASLFVVLLMPYILFQDGSYMPFLLRKDLNNDGNNVFYCHPCCFDSLIICFCS